MSLILSKPGHVSPSRNRDEPPVVESLENLYDERDNKQYENKMLGL